VRVGILVDAISQVTHLAKRIIQPESKQIGVADGKFIANVIQYKESFLILLNLDYLYHAIQL
jgi:chemotaxis signal transduction protein